MEGETWDDENVLKGRVLAPQLTENLPGLVLGLKGLGSDLLPAQSNVPEQVIAIDRLTQKLNIGFLVKFKCLVVDNVPKEQSPDPENTLVLTQFIYFCNDSLMSSIKRMATLISATTSRSFSHSSLSSDNDVKRS